MDQAALPAPCPGEILVMPRAWVRSVADGPAPKQAQPPWDRSPGVAAPGHARTLPALRPIMAQEWRLMWCQSNATMAHMDLRPYIDEIHDQLEAAAETGGEPARALAERLVAPLDAAIRLSFLDALAAAAQEITCELAPGSVEVRLRGRDPEFVVTAPTGPAGDDLADGTAPAAVDVSVGASTFVGDEGGMARINLRMPDHLKSRIDRAAAGQGLSVNAWLVRAAATALDHTDPSARSGPRGPQGSQRFSGWAR